jgi:hypothetical protein
MNLQRNSLMIRYHSTDAEILSCCCKPRNSKVDVTMELLQEKKHTTISPHLQLTFWMVISWWKGCTGRPTIAYGFGQLNLVHVGLPRHGHDLQSSRMTRTPSVYCEILRRVFLNSFCAPSKLARGGQNKCQSPAH